jgi:hypothetical protein
VTSLPSTGLARLVFSDGLVRPARARRIGCRSPMHPSSLTLAPTGCCSSWPVLWGRSARWSASRTLAAKRELPKRNVHPGGYPQLRRVGLVEVQTAAFPLVSPTCGKPSACPVGRLRHRAWRPLRLGLQATVTRWARLYLPPRAASCSSSPTWSAASGEPNGRAARWQRLRLRRSAGSRFPRPMHRVSPSQCLMSDGPSDLKPSPDGRLAV